MLVNEIFYSLQGEGANTGRAAVFIRLSGCNLTCHFCDTEFDEGLPMSLDEIAQTIAPFASRFIVWTGGEPTLQLRSETLGHFKALGYEQAIECNGSNPVPAGLDYITCSPKPETMHLLEANFPNGVDEWRFLVDESAALPPAIEQLPPARYYMLSPIFEGEDSMQINPIALQRCVAYIKQNPAWRLSLQTHKLIQIP